ncbi:MAG: methyltransferase domain-containing protein [Acidobacteriota bacterium]
MSATRASKEYFAAVAGRWDQIRGGYYDETIRDEAVAEARVSSKDVVADVGTGTGFMIAGLAPLAAKVFGFDESPEMLAIARKNLAAFRNVQLLEAPGQHLPVEDTSFDAVLASMYLHHAPEPPIAIAEMARVLKPGGRLVIVDADRHNQEWMRAEMADRWLGFGRDQIHAWYAFAGLTHIRIRCARSDCHPVDPAGEKLSLSVFLAYGEKDS